MIRIKTLYTLTSEKHLIRFHMIDYQVRLDGKVLRWIRSWLSNRQQRVTINGSKSNCGGEGNKWSSKGMF